MPGLDPPAGPKPLRRGEGPGIQELDCRASPGMTSREKSARSAKTVLRDWQDTIATGRLCKRAPACHIAALPEFFVKSPSSPPVYAHPARLILILSLAPTIGLGIGRFAYALVLPDMRDSLHWSYSAAGFMNTINAVGYLAGALLASRLIRRFGLAANILWGTIACVFSLALCASTGNFAALSIARLVAGFGGAACSAAARWPRPSHSHARSGRIFSSACSMPDSASAFSPPG
jgi:hypothetical protein